MKKSQAKGAWWWKGSFHLALQATGAEEPGAVHLTEAGGAVFYREANVCFEGICKAALI